MLPKIFKLQASPIPLVEKCLLVEAYRLFSNCTSKLKSLLTVFILNSGMDISGIPEYNATGKLALFMVRDSSVCPQPIVEASNKTKTKIFFIYKYLLFNGYYNRKNEMYIIIK